MNKQTVSEVGRASFTPCEVAERNNVSRDVIYKAIRKGRLKATNVGEGKRRTLRVTPAQEQEWLKACEAES